MSAIKRKYVMTRLAASDYVLPSNDAKKLFRIRYETDNELGGEGAPTRGWFVYEYNQPVSGRLDVDNGDNWDFYGGPHKSREEAVQDALV